MFDSRDPRFVYVALASDKKHLVCKLDTGAFYELPVQTLAIAEEWDGSAPISARTIQDETAALVVLESGVELDFPVDFVLHHCEPAYDYFVESVGNAERIGKNIRGVRQTKGLTLAEVAQRTGIAEPNLSRLEHGKHSPSIDTLKTVAKALDVRTAVLLAQHSGMGRDSGKKAGGMGKVRKNVLV